VIVFDNLPLPLGGGLHKKCLAWFLERNFTQNQNRDGSDRLNTAFSEVGAPVSAFHELTFRLVATAPSSDFVLPNNSIPHLWIRLLVQSYW